MNYADQTPQQKDIETKFLSQTNLKIQQDQSQKQLKFDNVQEYLAHLMKMNKQENINVDINDNKSCRGIINQNNNIQDQQQKCKQQLNNSNCNNSLIVDNLQNLKSKQLQSLNPSAIEEEEIKSNQQFNNQNVDQQDKKVPLTPQSDDHRDCLNNNIMDSSSQLHSQLQDAEEQKNVDKIFRQINHINHIKNRTSFLMDNSLDQQIKYHHIKSPIGAGKPNNQDQGGIVDSHIFQQNIFPHYQQQHMVVLELKEENLQSNPPSSKNVRNRFKIDNNNTEKINNIVDCDNNQEEVKAQSSAQSSSSSSSSSQLSSQQQIVKNRHNNIIRVNSEVVVEQQQQQQLVQHQDRQQQVIQKHDEDGGQNSRNGNNAVVYQEEAAGVEEVKVQQQQQQQQQYQEQQQQQLSIPLNALLDNNSSSNSNISQIQQNIVFQPTISNPNLRQIASPPIDSDNQLHQHLQQQHQQLSSELDPFQQLQDNSGGEGAGNYPGIDPEYMRGYLFINFNNLNNNSNLDSSIGANNNVNNARGDDSSQDPFMQQNGRNAIQLRLPISELNDNNNNNSNPSDGPLNFQQIGLNFNQNDMGGGHGDDSININNNNNLNISDQINNASAVLDNAANFGLNLGRVSLLNSANQQDHPQENMGSNDTSPRSIPDEHDLSVSYEDHYLDNYMCLMKGITWGRESHGLFDYGTRHPLKKQMKTEVEQVLVRTQNNDLYLLNTETDLTKIFDRQAQPLLNIRKQKNKYYLEALKVPKRDDLIPHIQSEVPNPPPVPVQQPNNNNNNNNVGGGAAAAGGNANNNNNNNANNANADDQQQQQDNCDLRERMYLIVRSMQKGEQKVPYKIKKHDIIKLGRVLFKVIEMRIDEIEQQREFKRWKEKRRQINQQKNQQLQQQKHHQHNNQNCQHSNCYDKDKPEEVNNDIVAGGCQIEKAQSVITMNYDVNLESCRECLEGEQNFLEIDCLVPEPSVKLQFKQDPQQLVKATSALPQSKNTMKQQDKSNICITQQQSIDNGAISPLYIGGNNILNGNGSQSNRHMNLSRGGNNRARSGDRQYKNERVGAAGAVGGVFQEFKQVISSKHHAMMMDGEDQKEEESLGDLQQQNEFAITKMDPNEVMNDEVVGLNSDANNMAVDKESPLCRFCWGSEIAMQNPLLASCKCNGGIKYIHFSCLKEWLNTKRTVKEQATITSYYYRSFECELCKTPYPLVFKAKNKRYNLVDSTRMTGDYMLIESLTLEQNLQRIVHVIQPSAFVRSINLGRGHDSDLRVNDISVSRCHAMIKLKKDGFYLKDNKSKFGTLVLIKHRLSLTPSMTKAVQVGRTVINFCIKKSPTYDFKEGEFHRINVRNRGGNDVDNDASGQDNNGPNGMGQDGSKAAGAGINLDQQRAKLLKHLENMQQAEDYIQKQAAEHHRLANGDNFHQRRYFVQQNIHEEEIKIDYDLRYPQLLHQNIIQVQNNMPSSMIRVDYAPDNINGNNIQMQQQQQLNGINNNDVNNNFLQQLQPLIPNNNINANLPGQENFMLQEDDDDGRRAAIQQIGSVVRDSEMFNLLRRSEHVIANNSRQGSMGSAVINPQNINLSNNVNANAGGGGSNNNNDNDGSMMIGGAGQNQQQMPNIQILRL